MGETAERLAVILSLVRPLLEQNGSIWNGMTFDSGDLLKNGEIEGGRGAWAVPCGGAMRISR